MRKTAYELRISDWSSDVCSSDLLAALGARCDGRSLCEAPFLGPPEAEAWASERVFSRERRLHLRRRPLRPGVDRAVQSREQRLVGERLSAPRRHLAAQMGRASCRESECQYV